jgi:pyruvate formate lyase activating enzyme
MQGRVFNIQRFAVHDGPGIRTTVFLKGCPAHCLWCHNPESQSPKPEILLFPERCVSCGSCKSVCANDTNPARCTVCGKCVDACPAEARQLAGRTMTVHDVMSEVTRDRVFYDESGGGVTFSGGEPLSQPSFLRALLSAAQDAQIATAVDTCGFAPQDVLLGIAPLVDLFLFDVKLMDPNRHLALTGIPLDPILSNLVALGGVHDNIWLRVPVVPGLTDSESDIEQIACLAASTPGIRRVNLLPYHRIGSSKFTRLGKSYELESVAPPAAAHMSMLAARFGARGVEARIGG